LYAQHSVHAVWSHLVIAVRVPSGAEQRAEINRSSTRRGGSTACRALPVRENYSARCLSAASDMSAARGY